MQSRDGLPQWHGYRLWLDHNLLAEKYTRGQKRIFITYDQLLRDPKATLEKIRTDLEGQWAELGDSAGSEATEFVTPRLRHHVAAKGTSSAALPELVARAYRALEELADGEGDGPLETLDEIRDAMSDAAALYRATGLCFCCDVEDVEGVVAACRKAAQPLPAVIAPVHFYFPAGDGGYREDLSAVHYVQLGRWSTVTMPVPISLNRASVIRIDPGDTRQALLRWPL